MNLGTLKRFPRRLKRAARAEVHAHARRLPVKPNTVFYESFSGNGMLDNPEAIFRALLRAPDLRHLTHIWTLTDLHTYRETVREFAAYPNVRFVRHGSGDYWDALATSEYVINNATFPPDFSKRPGQTYLNTWHGTPLKRMGYDIEEGAGGTSNIIRNFVQADHILAANRFMTEQMYRTAYKLKGIYRGTIIEEGYPRIDRQFLDQDEASAARARLIARGLPIGDRKIVLWAPTWKGESFGRPTDDVDELLRGVAELESRIDTSTHIVLLKTHQTVAKVIGQRPDLARMLVPNEIPTNLVLGVTDVLITDYSSIFFDFLATGRPVLFYTPDLDDYVGTRGLYFEPDEWPGPACTTMREVAAHITEIDQTGALPSNSAERYRDFQERFVPHEDGEVAERVVDIVFRGRRDGYQVITDHSDGRIPILIYLGGMRPNGITSSALNMLNNIDHTRFDVSAFFASTRARAAVAKQNQITPAVRQFPRTGGMNGSKLRHLARHLEYRRGRIADHAIPGAQNRLWDDEWYRCFGESLFDYVIDFSGYGPFWSTLLLHSPPAQRSIWLHNDLASDAHREVNGKKPMLHSLTQIFSLYPQYDHLVSVSPTLAEINKTKLSDYAPAREFTSAVNMVDGEHILNSADDDLREVAFDDELGAYPEWVDRVRDTRDVTTFVNVGRLSPEKNQSRLIRAFAAVHRDNPKTRLIIVGGGPLYDSLLALTRSLGVADAVILTDALRNPYTIMAISDCFVLSSNYEGQPMVLLEALVLDLPIVTVRFASAENALPPHTGIVVPQTDDDLADGMRAFLRGEVPGAPFDYHAYNRAAVGQFYRAIGMPESMIAPTSDEPPVIAAVTSAEAQAAGTDSDPDAA